MSKLEAFTDVLTYSRQQNCSDVWELWIVIEYIF